MAAHLVPVLDIGRQRAPQRLEFPARLLTIELQHIVPKGTLELAIRLGMLGRAVDEPDAQVPTEGLQQFPAKRATLVKDDALGNESMEMLGAMPPQASPPPQGPCPDTSA